MRRGFAQFTATGEFDADVMAPDFVWDMSTFRGWPEQQIYSGIEGAREFVRAWLEGWDEWEMDVEAFHDAGDKVVAIVRQRARSRATGLPVEMTFGMVWTIRDLTQTRMQMYADPEQALRAVSE
jgi:ketosteroid isomerase-like protein